MAIKICYVAGLSGGHIIPCLTLATSVKKKDPKAKITFFTSNAILDCSLLENNTVIDTHITIPLKRMARRCWHYPNTFFQFWISFFKGFFHFIKNRPDYILTTGSIVAVPICLAARFLRIPVQLYELNAVPGKTINFLTPHAHRIYTCFNSTKQYFPSSKVSFIPYPIRYEHTSSATDAEYRKILGLDPHRFTLFILGGSQGSTFLNTIMQKIVTDPEIDHSRIQIIHQTGLHDTIDWQSFYEKLHIPAYVFSFRFDIKPCYNAADLIISRAGAGTIFEIAFFKKPCILIPLETSGTTHQIDNAYAIANEIPQQFIVIEQEKISGDYHAIFNPIKNRVTQFYE